MLGGSSEKFLKNETDNDYVPFFVLYLFFLIFSWKADIITGSPPPLGYETTLVMEVNGKNESTTTAPALGLTSGLILCKRNSTLSYLKIV